MTKVMNIADIVNPDTGKTYRQENSEKIHSIPIGSLVEIIPWSDDCWYTGMRLYVVNHTRDCDGTPMYSLGSKEKIGYKTNIYDNVFGGFGEESLKTIEPTTTSDKESSNG